MEQIIERNEFYLVTGPSRIEVIDGTIEVIAARLGTGDTVTIPQGKKVPILALETARLSVDSSPESCVKMDVSSVPAEWDVLADRVASERKQGDLYKIMVLGEVDTGKTFFSTYLANRLVEKIGKTAILDCDSGQSDIGPPGTFGMLVMQKQTVFLTEEQPTHLYLVGAHSPGLHLLPTVTGLMSMLRKARNEADAIIIDTTGWVQGDGGRAVKKMKLDLVQPDMVILMQRGVELEHLVKHLPESRVVRLPVSKKASSTSQMDRKALRELVSSRYFKDARIIEIPIDQVFTDRSFFLSGRKFELEGTLHAERLSGWEGTLVVTSGPLIPEITRNWPKDLGAIKNFIAGEEKGLLVALLNSEQDVLTIARLEEIDFLKNCFRVRTPYEGKLDLVKGIQFGSLKVNEKGEEAGFLEPGLI